MSNEPPTQVADGPDIDAPSAGSEGAAPVPWRAWAVLGVVLVGEVLDLLDALITTIGGPPIVADLGGGEETLQWLSAAYTLAMAGGLLVGGRLGDRFGRRPTFLFGLAGFVLTSLLAAMAQNPEQILAARVAQGLLGALMLPQGLGMLREAFPPGRVGVAFGVFGPVMGLSAVAGPIVAGWLVDADLFGLGWRAIFAVNVPLGLAGLALGARWLPAPRPDRGLEVDGVGAVLAALASTALVYPLVQGREHDWPGWAFALLALSGVLFVAFGLQQAARARAGRDALVVPSLFRRRAFSGGLVVGLVFFAGFMGSGLVLAVLFQVGLGLSPSAAGVAMTPQAVGMILGFVAAQALGTRRRTMILGLAGSVVGQAALVLTLVELGSAVGPWWIAPGLLITGIGAGTAMGPFFDLVLAGVDDHENGSASGALTAVQQVAAAAGVALLGTVLFSVVGTPAPPLAGAFAHAGAWTYAVATLLTLAAIPLTALLLPAKGSGDGHAA